MGKLESHEDLVAWQLAEELKDRIMEIIARPGVKRDPGFCDEIGRSSRSAPANLSEAFWRYRPRDRARFVEFAIGSLGETRSHLGEGRKRNHLSAEEYEALRRLNLRALGASIRWHTYLETCQTRPTGRSSKPPTRGRKNAQRAEPQDDEKG